MKIRFTFSFIVVFLSLLLCNTRLSLSVITAATLHELGHILAAKALGIRISELKLDAFGASITKESELLSYRSEILLCLAGPIVNFLSFIILLPFSCAIAEDFMLSSLALGSLNLLPIDGFDGAHVFYALLCRILPLHVAGITIKLISFICIFSLWSLSIYLIIRLSASLSLFVFSAMLFVKIFFNKTR